MLRICCQETTAASIMGRFPAACRFPEPAAVQTFFAGRRWLREKVFALESPESFTVIRGVR